MYWTMQPDGSLVSETGETVALPAVSPRRKRSSARLARKPWPFLTHAGFVQSYGRPHRVGLAYLVGLGLMACCFGAAVVLAVL